MTETAEDADQVYTDAVLADATRRLWQRTLLIGSLACVLLLLGYGILQAEIDDPTVRLGVFILTAISLVGVASLGTVLMRSGFGTGTAGMEGLGARARRRLRELEDRVQDLERSNQELEQFAYVASHDLQEPLRMLASYLRMLESDLEGELDADAQECIEYALDGADRMSQLIQGLLTYARVGSRAEPMEPVAVDEALDQALENLSLAIDETGAIIERGDLPTVKGDVTQLTQLFQNLVSNAIKFRKEGQAPQVKVYAEGEPGAWLIHVKDSGIGFHPAEKEDMFQIFQRVSSGKDRAGTGVGLAVCKRIVNRHGGHIDVTAQPGNGADFQIRLPAIPPTAEQETEEETIEQRSQELV